MKTTSAGPKTATVGSTLRTALALVLPFAVLLPVTAGDVAGFAFGWDNPEEAATFAPTLAVFGPALVVFTVHYFMLRGFYAMEMTRLVFFIQLAVSSTNVVVATLLVPPRPPEETAPLLVVAYLASYCVGAVVSYFVLRRTIAIRTRNRSSCGVSRPPTVRRRRTKLTTAPTV